MSSNFREIADFHRLEAARHAALAQLAREKMSRSEFAYHSDLALRHAETARQHQEQNEGCPPGTTPQPPRCWPLESTVQRPLAARVVSATLHGVEQLAAALRHAVQHRGGDGPQSLFPH